MKSSSQLSDVLHVLLHMAQAEGPLTSEALAAAMSTNPVVLRRLLAGLRDAGFLASGKGHGGGWVVTAPLDRITLRDVHRALGGPPLVSLGFREDRPSCLVAQVVNDTLRQAMQDAEATLLARFEGISLAELAKRFEQGLRTHRHGHKHEHEHEHKRRPASIHRLEDHHGRD